MEKQHNKNLTDSMCSVNYTQPHRNKAQILEFVFIWENKRNEIALQNQCIY